MRVRSIMRRYSEGISKKAARPGTLAAARRGGAGYVIRNRVRELGKFIFRENDGDVTATKMSQRGLGVRVERNSAVCRLGSITFNGLCMG